MQSHVKSFYISDDILVFYSFMLFVSDLIDFIILYEVNWQIYYEPLRLF